jgi:hypothetical protein
LPIRDRYADFVDGIFSLLGMILGKFDTLDAMFQVDSVLLPILFALIVFILNFTGLTLLLSSIGEAFDKVLERKKKTPDTFARELALALRLLWREAYWNVATPITFMFAERRMKKRQERERMERQEQGSNWSMSTKVHPREADGSPRALLALVPTKKHNEHRLTRKERKERAKEHAEAELVVERISRIKSRLLAGQHVKEEDVQHVDVVETVAYVAHRQAILLRRLHALLSLVQHQEEALTAFNENEPEEEVDPYDPSAHADVASIISNSSVHHRRRDARRSEKETTL